MDNSIVQHLKEFGLNEYEARAYLALTIHGPVTASAISSYTGVASSKIYEILNSMQAKMLIEMFSSKPKKYRAIDPDYILKKIIEERRKSLEALKEKTESFLSKIKPPDNGFHEMLIGRGKETFLHKATEILRRTKSFGYSTTFSFSRCCELEEELKKAVKRGVKIKMLGTGSVDDKFILAKAKWYEKNGAEVRVLPLDTHPVLGLRDDEEACIRVDNGPEPEFIWSNNPALISVVKCYFDNLWERARTLDEFTS